MAIGLFFGENRDYHREFEQHADDRSPKEAEDRPLPTAEGPDPGTKDNVGFAHGFLAHQDTPNCPNPPDEGRPHGDTDQRVAGRLEAVDDFQRCSGFSLKGGN